jgi:hypothetical protein
MTAAITYRVSTAIVTPPNGRTNLADSSVSATDDNSALTAALAAAVAAGHPVISVRIIGLHYVCVEVRS